MHRPGCHLVLISLIENLVGFFSASIKDNSTIQTVVRDGKIPFVSVEDIAQVAYDAIVNPSTLKTKEPWIIGPELASYADVRSCSINGLLEANARNLRSPDISALCSVGRSPTLTFQHMISSVATYLSGSQKATHSSS